MGHSRSVDNLSEAEINEFKTHFNKSFTGVPVKILDVKSIYKSRTFVEINPLSNSLTDSLVITIWVVSLRLASKLYSKYRTDDKRFLYLKSLRKEFLKGSSKRLKTFYEFTTTGNIIITEDKALHPKYNNI